MALWFDVTDICIWNSAQLTGIPRTVASTLSELLTFRSDLRMFRYNYITCMLEEVDGRALPPLMRSHVYGASAWSDEPLPPPASVPADPLIATTPLTTKLPWRRRVLDFVRRWGNEEIEYALKDCVRDGRYLAGALRRRFLPAKPLPPPGAPAPAAVEPASSKPPQRPFFASDDVCVSISATWGFPGYGEEIARQKAAIGFKCVSLIYDLIPTLFPQWLSPGYTHIITLWARQQIVNADLILTISEFQKREIATYIKNSGLPERRITPIRLGDNPKLLKEDSPALPRYVPSRPFVMCVSTLDVRKNQTCLYQVWRRLAQELGRDCPELLLIGIPHELVSNLMHQIRYDPLVNHVIAHLRDIEDAELAWYYRNCLFTVYPSFYEGWGLPVSESLALGRYCIASNSSSLPEVGGDLVDYFDPIDYLHCYRLVRRAIAEPAYVAVREQNIRERYRAHTWRDTAVQICALTDEVSAAVKARPVVETIGMDEAMPISETVSFPALG